MSNFLSEVQNDVQSKIEDVWKKGYAEGYKKGKEDHSQTIGNWTVIHSKIPDTPALYLCPKCKKTSFFNYAFCPSCGLKMKTAEMEAESMSNSIKKLKDKNNKLEADIKSIKEQHETEEKWRNVSDDDFAGGY